MKSAHQPREKTSPSNICFGDSPTYSIRGNHFHCPIVLTFEFTRNDERVQHCFKGNATFSDEKKKMLIYVFNISPSFRELHTFLPPNLALGVST